MVEQGKFVAIHYTGKLDGGEVFDSCDGNPPFEFQVGAGMVIPGLDDAVVGMALNGEKDIVVTPDFGYGEYNDEMVQSFPIEDIRQQFEPQEGMMVGVQMENGMQVPATITSVTDTEVSIDLNHPLAGKTLYFHVKVVEINDDARYCNEEGGCSSCGGSCGSPCC